MARREPPFATSRREGSCNEIIHGYDSNSFRVYYCARPDNGSGVCNVHQAARERGARQRVQNARVREQLRLARLARRKA